MKLCYQVATPDVAVAPSVTAFQGSLEDAFSTLSQIGYDGVELMTLDPEKLNWDEVKRTAKKYELAIPLVCTGEIFGQLGLSFVDADADVRKAAVKKVCDIIDFAGHLNADINIGRVRGQYHDGVDPKDTRRWVVEAFKHISDHAKPLGVRIALESVTILQTNFINTVSEAAGFVDIVSRDNFKLMMDVFHLNIEEKNLLETIRQYNKYNIHVHLADNNRRYPGHCGINFEAILREFHSAGYDGAFCTEIYQIPDQKAAAEGAMKHLAPIFNSVYGREVKRRGDWI